VSVVGKEGIVGHYAGHLGFLRDLAEAAGKNRKIILFFPNNQEKGSLKKAVTNGSIE
jgi:hypothetical protein